MIDPSARRASQVLALLDDAAAGAAVLELSSALARAMQRELSVVYVESARARVAAALPFTQVLRHGSARWVPLQPGDVEQGFRAHARRLRELTARVALRDTLKWSLRVMRGSLGDVAIDLRPESDLLLVAATPPIEAPGRSGPRKVPRRPVVRVLGGDTEDSGRALGVATQLAQALAGVLDAVPYEAVAKWAGQAARRESLARADVLVLPRAPVDATLLAQLRCPVLLVG
jgi:hypothetical protein